MLKVKFDKNDCKSANETYLYKIRLINRKQPKAGSIIEHARGTGAWPIIEFTYLVIEADSTNSYAIQHSTSSISNLIFIVQTAREGESCSSGFAGA